MTRKPKKNPAKERKNKALIDLSLFLADIRKRHPEATTLLEDGRHLTGLTSVHHLVGLLVCFCGDRTRASTMSVTSGDPGCIALQCLQAIEDDIKEIRREEKERQAQAQREGDFLCTPST